MEVKLSDWIGNTRNYFDEITPAVAQKMAALLDIKDMPLEKGDSLPLLWHWLFFNSTTLASSLGPDGHGIKGGFLPPVTLPRRMWAGGRLKFQAPLILGQKVEKKSKILNVIEKQGRAGPLVFVTVQHVFTTNGQTSLTEEHDIVYREMPSGVGQGEVEAKLRNPPEGAKWQHSVTPDPVMLFRYSAVTFNGHRIHYDRDYCKNVEGYPGLIFHGPLTATLMLKFFQSEYSALNIEEFSFRALSPLFDTAPFTIEGKMNNKTGDIWALNPNGELAMEAKVTLS